MHLEAIASDRLTDHRLRTLRRLFDEAFGEGEERLDEDDWEHMLGGIHFVLLDGGDIAAHASVVPRDLETGGHVIRTGYVEAVATWPQLQGHGHGTQLMHAAHEHIDARFELGALGAGAPAFYKRLGWQPWQGPTAVRTPDRSVVSTPDDDGYVYVRLTPSTPPLDLTAQLICDWRAGDVW
jgi:aminoglycoside 2'-N-acetyltransferase I